MAFQVVSENTIIKCSNPDCKANFSVLVYTFKDKKCTTIDETKLIPLTGNTPYYCPCCGVNLGKPEPIPRI